MRKRLSLGGFKEVLEILQPSFLPRVNSRQTATTTGVRSDPRAFTAFSSSAHNHAVMASLMFSRASCSSCPCDTQPGSAGHCATIHPSSAFSTETWKIIGLLSLTWSLTREVWRDRLLS